MGAMRFSVLVPVLNEEAILETALTRLARALAQAQLTWEVVVVDGGSRDGSQRIARQTCECLGESWKAVVANLASPSVGKTVAAGLQTVTGKTVLVLPCDTAVESAALTALARAVTDEGKTCGGFEKTYTPSTGLLALYAQAQNRIRTRFGRHLVWTNGIFFPVPVDKSEAVPTDGFLEDVILSDRLRRAPGWTLLSPPIEVSARRYYPNRVVKRILLNAVILCGYRLGIAGPPQLRRLYLSLR